MDPIIGKGLDKIIEGAADGPIKTLNTTWDLIFAAVTTFLYFDKEFEKLKKD